MAVHKIEFFLFVICLYRPAIFRPGLPNTPIFLWWYFDRFQKRSLPHYGHL